MVRFLNSSPNKTQLALALLGGGVYSLVQLQVTSAFTAFLSSGLVFIPPIAFGNDQIRVFGPPAKLMGGGVA